LWWLHKPSPESTSSLCSCRVSCSITLDDDSTLIYDLLVLAPGLHNQTLSTVQASGVAGVSSVAELAANFSYGDAAAVQDIVVYGDTLEAYTAKALLESRGVDLGKSVMHIAPLANSGDAVRVMHEVCRSVRLHTAVACACMLAPVQTGVECIAVCDIVMTSVHLMHVKLPMHACLA
jgi:hypothetical protein